MGFRAKLHDQLSDSPSYHGAGLVRAGRTWGAISTGTGTLLLVNGRVYLTPFLVPRAAEVSDPNIEVTTVGTAGAIARVGIYRNDRTTQRPIGTPLYDFGTVATTGGGVQFFNGDPFPVLSPDVYWMATVGQGSPITQATLRAFTGLLPVFGIFAPLFASDLNLTGVHITNPAEPHLGALPTILATDIDASSPRTLILTA